MPGQTPSPVLGLYWYKIVELPSCVNIDVFPCPVFRCSVVVLLTSTDEQRLMCGEQRREPVQNIQLTIITARCTLVQSAVLRSHVVCLSICPSVRLSVTLVDQDHIRWKSWKPIARTSSLTLSLLVAQRPSTYSLGKFWGD